MNTETYTIDAAKTEQLDSWFINTSAFRQFLLCLYELRELIFNSGKTVKNIIEKVHNSTLIINKTS